MADIASSVVTTTIELLGKLDPSVQKAFQAAEKQAGGAGKKIGVALAAGIGAISVAAGAVVKQVAEIGDEYQRASGQIGAATGATGKELEGLQDVMKSVYANNFGDSMEDVGDAIATVKQQMKGLNDSELQTVTESAFLLRDVFDYDVAESVRASKAIMDQFGTSGEHAMALIATGAQNGLDYSGELLDSISEYSVQFKKVGFSADDMFNIMQKGADTGAFNLDKVGDAIKEFSIRAVDGSDTTIQGFQLLGLNAEEMSAKFAAGGDTAREAFFQVAGALASMEDPLAQNTAGVVLFGTMWEDLGPEVVAQLSSISDEAYASSDVLESMNDVKYDSLSAALEGVGRKIDVALIPAGEAISDLVQNVISWVDQIGGLSGALDAIVQAAQPYAPLIAGIATAVLLYAAAVGGATLAQTIHNGVMAAGTAIAGAFSAAMAAVNWPLLAIAAAIAVVVAAGVWLYQNWEYVQQVAAQVWAYLTAAWNSIKTTIANAISGAVSAIVNGFNSAWAFLSGIFETIKSAVFSFASYVKTTISNAFNALVGIVRAPFDTILGIIDKVKGAVGGLLSKITGAKSEAASISVPAYASGGTITAPQLAVVGDAPETIVPHGNTPRNRQLLAEAAAGVGAGFGGDKYVVNFNVTIDGNASGDVRAQILEAEQEFERKMDAYFARRSRRAFA